MNEYEKLKNVFSIYSLDELDGLRYEAFNSGFCDYVFTEKGDLFRVKRMNSLCFLRKIKSSVTRGYTYYKIRVGENKYDNFLVHRMLAIFFIPNPENKPEVNHKDKNRLNNSLDNLEWVTKSENERHKRLTYKTSEETKKKISRALSGSGNHKSKRVRCIETGKTWQSSNEASKELGLSRNAIANAINMRCKAKGMHWEYID